ncbi:hypothetical protein TIFTF001_020170 [Ficus carica]|uniref:Uncharacterized protein n=1 Tax=Ficus carica TaxID=3494 RepID=A0AA88DCD7_FICCA|nr:hypothetical protein TIFTF001_020170 [Ficus carica]
MPTSPNPSPPPFPPRTRAQSTPPHPTPTSPNPSPPTLEQGVRRAGMTKARKHRLGRSNQAWLGQMGESCETQASVARTGPEERGPTDVRMWGATKNGQMCVGRLWACNARGVHGCKQLTQLLLPHRTFRK